MSVPSISQTYITALIVLGTELLQQVTDIIYHLLPTTYFLLPIIYCARSELENYYVINSFTDNGLWPTAHAQERAPSPTWSIINYLSNNALLA